MSWRNSGIRRDKYDALFSDLVRERADWTCERCNREFRHDRGSLHCSHIFGRAKQSIRVHPDNALAHCTSCHRHLEQHPIEFAEHAREILGQQRYDRLRLMAAKPTKITKFDKEVVHQHYLGERARILALRKDGARGHIEFTLP
jgi:hypothetical protein